jgi:hypothetical protein
MPNRKRFHLGFRQGHGPVCVNARYQLPIGTFHCKWRVLSERTKLIKYLCLAAIATISIGCSGGDKGGAPGVSGMSVDKSGAIHDNHGNTYTAAPNGLSEKDFAVPFYPGSTGDGDDGGLSKSEDANNKYLIARRDTKDSVAQVMAFYKDKFQGPAPITGGGDHQIQSGDLPGNVRLSVMVNKEEDRGTVITVAEAVKK